MSDLAEFLLARIAQDEQKIAHMTREKKRVETAPIYAGYPPNWLAGVDIFVSPDRWSAECEAKRRMVELHAVTVEKVSQSPFDPHTGERRPDEFDVHCAVCGWATEDPSGACDTLRLLALPYADHPDYRDEWRP